MDLLNVAQVQFELAQLTFPGLHDFSCKDRSSICNMLRWLTLYRKLEGNPIPKPVGTMLELVLMLDLFVMAWYDFNFMAHDIRVNDYISPAPIGDLATLVDNLKSKALMLSQNIPYKTTMPVGMGPTFQWFNAYRKLKNDVIPRPVGTPCECLMILDLTEKALVDYSVSSTIRAKMNLAQTIDITALKTAMWKLLLPAAGNSAVSDVAM